MEDIAKMKNVPYREAVGSLMYAAMGTRPDIRFTMSIFRQSGLGALGSSQKNLSIFEGDQELRSEEHTSELQSPA